MSEEIIKKGLYGLITLSLFGNGYFIKGLVDEINETKKIVWQLRQEVVVLGMRIDGKFVQEKRTN